MLTADHVHTRRRGEDLFVVPLQGERVRVAHEMAEIYAAVARAHVGRDRQAFMDACKAVTAAWRQQDRRLADGILKLVCDRCVFEEETPLAAPMVRAEVFGRAAELRKQSTSAAFDRKAVLDASALALQTDAASVEAALYGDLPGAHILKQALVPEPALLVKIYNMAQVQAVFLRATSVVATVTAEQPARLRHLFRVLKFQQLLFAITPVAGGYQIAIDGPFSLFDAVTRYGLKLALALPAIMACAHWSLTAEVLWGRERQPLRFRLKGTGLDEETGAPPLPEPVVALLQRWPALQTPWRVEVSSALLDLPGVGVCVPDLQFVHQETAAVVHFEQLGFWSRDAVWKRVELVQAGLPFAVVFGVSKSLRVSEAALSDELPAALYVFAKVPSAKALLERISQVAAVAASRL